MADEELRLVVAAEDQFTATTDKAVASLEAIAGQADAAQKSLGDLDWKLPPLDTRELDASFARLEKTHEEYAGHVAEFGKEVEQATAKGSDGASNMGKELQGAFNVIKGGAALWGANRTIEEVMQFGEAGAELVNLQQGFDSAAEAAGIAGPEMMAQIMAVGGGIIDDDAAMREFILTTRAAGSGIASEWPQLIQVALASTAQGIGTAQGNLEQLDQYIRTGFGRGLKQMGIMVPDAGPMMDAYAATLGTTADRLTEAEQAQARMNAVLTTARTQFGDLDEAASELAGGGITSLRNAWGNFIEFLQTETQGPINDVANWLAEAIASGTPGTEQNFDQIVQGIDQVRAGLAYASQGDFAVSQGWIDESVRNFAAGLDVAALSAANYELVLKHIAVQSPAVAGEFAAQRREAEATARTTELLANASHGAGGALNSMGVEALSAVGGLSMADGIARLLARDLGLIATNGQLAAGALTVLSDAGPLGDYGVSKVWEVGGEVQTSVPGARPDLFGNLIRPNDLAIEPGKMGEAYDYAARAAIRLGDIQSGIQEPQRDWYETESDFITSHADWAVSEYERVASAGKTAFNGMQSEMEKLYSAWESEASAAISPTQSIDFDAEEAALGQRTDEFDEKARRAMSVVKEGTGNEWAGPMGFESREEALQYVKDFYAGKLPETEYNWDAAIANVQEQQGQASGQQWMIDMLAQKMGFGAGGEGLDLGAAMGFAGGTADEAGAVDTGLNGGTAATAFGDSFKAYDWLNNVGKPVGENILSGAITALQKPSTAFTDSMKNFVIAVVHDYYGI